jgi:hypothetical protein
MLKIKIIKVQDFPQTLTQSSVGKVETYIGLAEVKRKVRGAVYPISLRSCEEYQLPLSGMEHFVICLEGQIAVIERKSGEKNIITQGELIRVTRTGNKEYPNLQIKSLDLPSQAYWIPIHPI